MIAPARFHPINEDNEGTYPGPTLDPQVLRDETRVEGSIGVEMREKRVFASLVLMPYLVAASGSPSGSCRVCDHWDLDSYHSNFGAALFFSFGISFSLTKSRLPTRERPNFA